MKKLLIILLCSFSLSAFSQNDSLYAMKNGVIIHSFSIDSNHIDSIIFYRPNITTPSITDADGNVYTSVTIGTQEWMTENLRTTKYSDGTAIPNVIGNTDWENLSTGAWCHYDNYSQYDTVYGKLYNWYAVETGKLCPTGWHVPTDAEWTVLTDYLIANGHSGAEGKALKSTFSCFYCIPSGWDYDGNGTDDYGWNGLPCGSRLSSGVFYIIGESGLWWSSSQINSSNAWSRYLNYYHDIVYRSHRYKKDGFSVRCLRD